MNTAKNWIEEVYRSQTRFRQAVPEVFSYSFLLTCSKWHEVLAGADRLCKSSFDSRPEWCCRVHVLYCAFRKITKSSRVKSATDKSCQRKCRETRVKFVVLLWLEQHVPKKGNLISSAIIQDLKLTCYILGVCLETFGMFLVTCMYFLASSAYCVVNHVLCFGELCPVWLSGVK